MASQDRQPMRFRTLWISDIHLGTDACRADRLLDLLKLTESESLYLVGDIIDSWELKRRWHWDQIHNEVVNAIFDKAIGGTRVVFIPGNHDEAFQKFIGLDLGGIQIRNELVHVTAQGKRMLVLHGDRFDGAVRGARWLRWIDRAAVPIVFRTLQMINNWHGRIGLPYWSLSRHLHFKDRAEVTAAYHRSFEDALLREVSDQNLDGVICGHTHHPVIRNRDGLLYCNDGDWVEHQSAIAEDMSGVLRLLTWHDLILQSDRDALINEGGAMKSGDQADDQAC